MTGQRGASPSADGQFYSVPEAWGTLVLRKPSRHVFNLAVISVVTVDTSRKRNYALSVTPSKDENAHPVTPQEGGVWAGAAPSWGLARLANVAPMLDVTLLYLLHDATALQPTMVGTPRPGIRCRFSDLKNNVRWMFHLAGHCWEQLPCSGNSIALVQCIQKYKIVDFRSRWRRR